MFTQLNQYHVILEVEPEFRDHPVDLRDLFIRSGVATALRRLRTPASWQAGSPLAHPDYPPPGLRQRRQRVRRHDIGERDHTV